MLLRAALRSAGVAPESEDAEEASSRPRARLLQATLRSAGVGAVKEEDAVEASARPVVT